MHYEMDQYKKFCCNSFPFKIIKPDGQVLSFQKKKENHVATKVPRKSYAQCPEV